MSERQKIAAWIAFGAIGGGLLSVLFDMLFCQIMNAIIEAVRFQSEHPSQFALGAIVTGSAIAFGAWWKRYRDDPRP